MILAAVLRSGGVYDREWVWRLRRQANEHLPHDEFVYLTDLPCSDMWAVSLEHDWEGWWAKAELFRPGLFDDRVVYLDLDTLIVGDASLLSGYEGAFAALRDFYAPSIDASGVMAWDGRDPPPIYEVALSDPPPMNPRRRFDLWWNQFVSAEHLQDLFPGIVGSYKADQLQDGPRDFPIVCFHGRPRLTDLSEDSWARRAWEGRA